MTVITFMGAFALVACGDDDNKGDNNGGGNNGGGNNGGGSNGGGNGGGNNGGASCNESACMECVFGGDDLTACIAACEGCDDEGGGGGDGDGDTTGGGDGDGDGDGDDQSGNVPQKECRRDSDCGVSYQCVSCKLTDYEGWCEQTKECSHDTDCKVGQKCGYRVESGYRCLPADYCE